MRRSLRMRKTEGSRTLAGSLPARSTELYYRLSGGFSGTGAIKAVLMAILFAVPVAGLYGWFAYRSPSLALTLLATILFGRYLGAVTDFYVRKNLVRNVPLGAVIGAAVALAGLHFGWAVWIHLATQLPILPMALNPVHLWKVIAMRNAEGIWPCHGGIILWLVLGAQAFLVLGMTVYHGTYKLRRSSFCENCGQWAKSTEGICYVAAGVRPNIQNRDAMKAYRGGLKAMDRDLRQHLEAKDLAYLERLGAVPGDAIAWFSLDLQSCQCGQTNTLRLTVNCRRIDYNKVKDDAYSKEIFRQLALSPGEAEALRRLGQQMAPQLPMLMKERLEPDTVETVSGR